jgi:hypothetical protein
MSSLSSRECAPFGQRTTKKKVSGAKQAEPSTINARLWGKPCLGWLHVLRQPLRRSRRRRAGRHRRVLSRCRIAPTRLSAALRPIRKIDFPRSIDTIVRAINARGDLAGSEVDADGNSHGFAPIMANSDRSTCAAHSVPLRAASTTPATSSATSTPPTGPKPRHTIGLDEPDSRPLLPRP